MYFYTDIFCYQFFWIDWNMRSQGEVGQLNEKWLTFRVVFARKAGTMLSCTRFNLKPLNPSELSCRLCVVTRHPHRNISRWDDPPSVSSAKFSRMDINDPLATVDGLRYGKWKCVSRVYTLSRILCHFVKILYSTRCCQDSVFLYIDVYYVTIYICIVDIFDKFASTSI